eukprot:646639_1
MAQAATITKAQVKDRLKSGEYRLLRIKNPPAFIGLAHEQTRTNFCDLLGYSDDEEDEEDVQGQDEVDTYLALNISSHDRSLSKDKPHDRSLIIHSRGGLMRIHDLDWCI